MVLRSVANAPDARLHPVLLYKVSPQILPFAKVIEPLATIQGGILDMMLHGVHRLFSAVLTTGPDAVRRVDFLSPIVGILLIEISKVSLITISGRVIF